MNKSEFERRLIEFFLKIIKITNGLPNTKAANNFGGQLLRSGTSPAFNYAEAQRVELRNDFIQKNRK